MSKCNLVGFLNTETLIKRACVHTIFLPLRIYLLRKLLKLWDNNHNLLIPLDIYKKKKILTWQEPGDSHSDGNVLRFSHKFQLTLKLCAFLSQLKRNGPLKIKITMRYHFTSVRMAIIKKNYQQ